MDELNLSKATSVELRLSHAKHFLCQYKLNCGPPIDSYWLMSAYLDAFLFAFASIGEMSSAAEKAKLNAISVFRFFKALRNIAAHHSILAVILPGSKFSRPFFREVSVSVGGSQNDSSRLFFRLDILREILDAVEMARPREGPNIEAARAYIGELESRGGRVALEDIMDDAVSAVDSALFS